jgi:hypothetical protein
VPDGHRDGGGKVARQLVDGGGVRTSRTSADLKKKSSQDGEEGARKERKVANPTEGSGIVTLMQAIEKIVDHGLENKQRILEETRQWKRDQERIALSLHRVLQKQSQGETKQLSAALGDKYAGLTRSREVTLIDYWGKTTVERGVALVHVGLARLWKRPEYEQAWDITAMQIAMQAMMSACDSVSISDEEFRAQVLMDPAVPEAIAEGGTSKFSPLWSRMCIPRLRSAEAVSVPILIKTRQRKGIGHWISATFHRSGLIHVTDWLYGADDNPRERVERHVSLLLKELEKLWGLSAWSWTGNSREQATQKEAVTCGPRCLLGLLCQYVEDGAVDDLGIWQKDISAFQDAVMQKVDDIVVDFSAKGEEPIYDRGALLQSARERPTTTRTGQRDDAIMITPEGEAEYDDKTGVMTGAERRQSVERSGVALFTPAGGGCHVDRGRPAK